MIETLQPGPAASATVAGAPAAGPLPPRTPGMSRRTIRRHLRDDGICVLTLDRPDSSANIFDRGTLLELGEELDFIAGAPQVRGLVVTSAKRSIFIAGADLKSMSEAGSPEAVRELIELGQDVMNRLAALAVPTVAAIHGAAVGGGYELCLACDYRVASSDRATRVGLPETQLGLLPGWGGSTRLPRLIGLPRALDIILAGKTLAAKPAWKRGLVDELVPVEYLEATAVKLIGRGKSRRRRHPFQNHALAAAALAARLRSVLRRRTRGHYPAVLKALEVATRGISKSVPQSLALERDGILELVRTDACRNLIRVFFLQERAKKLASAGPGSPKPVARAAVIGSGVMGAGIAQWLSARDCPVILRDLNPELLSKGMAAIARTYQDAAKRHALTPLEVRQGMDRIYPAPADVPLHNVDLVIEAAVEKLDLKKQIFRRLDELAGRDTLLATNTSALPVSELAASTRHPERVLGLHFFNPVHRMQLVEIVAAPQTAPEALQRALRFVQQIGKLPVVVQDSPGFLVNRILMPYLVEAGNLFEAGAGVRELDEAMLEFGMPMGPMSLLDEVGIDVALHVARTLAASFSDRMSVPGVLDTLIQAGCLGRKSGRGFYVHARGKKPRVNPQATPAHPGALKSAPPAALQERMVLLMINEAARCLEEGVVRDPADVDFAMIMGTGFAPFRGGPLRHADAVGAGALVAAMDRLANAGAAHFKPCELLRSLAAGGKTFYPKS